MLHNNLLYDWKTFDYPIKLYHTYLKIVQLLTICLINFKDLYLFKVFVFLNKL